MTPEEEAERKRLCERALNVRDIWLAIARVLRVSRAKRKRVAVTTRRCRQLARVAEETSIYVWGAPAHELVEIAAQLATLLERADRAMLAIGMAGHGASEK